MPRKVWRVAKLNWTRQDRMNFNRNVGHISTTAWDKAQIWLHPGCRAEAPCIQPNLGWFFSRELEKTSALRYWFSFGVASEPSGLWKAVQASILSTAEQFAPNINSLRKWELSFWHLLSNTPPPNLKITEENLTWFVLINWPKQLKTEKGTNSSQL